MKETTKLMMIALIVILLSAGLFFIIKPETDNNKNLNKQEDLIDAIEQGAETIEIELEKDDSEPDYYSIDFNEEIKAMIKKGYK